MNQLLQNAAYGTIMILTVVILRRVLKGRLSPAARLALWGVCLFRLLTPRPVRSVLSLWGLVERLTPAPAEIGTQSAPISAPVVTGPVYVLEPGKPIAPAAPVDPSGAPAAAAFPWETVLMAAWVLVGAALTVWYLVGWLRARRAVACAIPVEKGDPKYRVRCRFLPQFAQLREGPVEGAPLTFGVVKPQVVLSPGLDGGELACVLAHEGVHARRRDNLWHYAMAAALAAHWWNPAVWLMSRLRRRDIELACDRAALKQLGEGRRAEYAQALVTLSTQGEGNGPAFCQSFGRKATEERIRSIMKFKKPTVIGVVLTLVLVLGVSIAFASDPKAPKEDDTEGLDTSAYGGDGLDVTTAPAATDEQDSAWVYDEDGNLVTVDIRGASMPWPVCDDPDCPMAEDDERYGEHYHDQDQGGIGVRVGVAAPEQLCTQSGCTANGVHQHDGVRYSACAATCTPRQYAAALDAWVALGAMDRQEADGWLEIFQTCYDRVQAGDCDAFYYNVYNGTQMASAFYKSDRVAAGYPVNSKGETYGPNQPEVYGSSPDLILARGTNGEEGYVRDSDDPGSCVRNPEEAMIYMEWKKTRPDTEYVPLYDCEGNVIGRFAYGNNSGYTADPSVKPEDAQLAMDAWLAYLASREQAAAQATPQVDVQTNVTVYLYPECHVDGCTAVGQHTHNGVTYCNISVPVSVPVAVPACGLMDCAQTGIHTHDGVSYNGTLAVCTLSDCGNNCLHSHNGVSYKGWTGKQPVVDTVSCTVAGCTQTGEHHHDPAQTLCTTAGCTATGEHDHNGIHYCGTAVACTVDGCGSTGVHEHNGVTYNGCANGAHHASAAGSTTSSSTTGSHHSSGHHGGGHH